MMRTVAAFLLVATAMTIGSAAGAQAPPDAAAITLRPGDAVRLAVKDEPSLTGEFPVTDAGQMLLPEIGLVTAAGRPFAQVEREVRAAYGRLLVGADIVLVPIARIAVLGEVRKPGLFPVDPTQTLADVLASAGGVTPIGDPNRIALVRDGRTTRLRISPDERALAGHLRSGDELVIGQYGWLRQNMPVLVGAGASVVAAAVTSLIIRH